MQSLHFELQSPVITVILAVINGQIARIGHYLKRFYVFLSATLKVNSHMPEYKAELKHVRRSYMDALESFRRHLAEFDQLWLFTFLKKMSLLKKVLIFHDICF